jgi:DNA-binding PadR family transcriptional regulator
MSTKHALLGLLLEGPSYPYQLADRLKERIGPAWAVGSGQVYNTISQMENDGLIEPVGSNMTGQDKRRRFFSITDGGEREFEGWLETISGAVRLRRRPELLKITLAGPERLDTALRHIDAYEESCMRRLNEFREARDLVPHRPTRVRADHLLLRLNLSFDISMLESELQHAREARETLLWLHAQPDAIWPSTASQSRLQDAHNWQGAREELFEGMAATRTKRETERLGR